MTGWEYVRPGVGTVPTVDLAFTEAILNWLRGTGRVDMERVYAAGFSSGGDFTWQLTQLNRSVNWFRGYAPVSAIVNTSMTALADPAACERTEAARVYDGYRRLQLVTRTRRCPTTGSA